MIDYDKLKLVHELATKYYEKTGFNVLLEISAENNSSTPFTLHINKINYHCSSIDEAIVFLQDLSQCDTKTKTKYQIGQKVWIYKDGIYSDVKIDDIIYKWDTEELGYKYMIHCGIVRYYVRESELFESLKDLIDHQIEYWSNLQTKESLDKCMSESLSIYQSRVID